MTVISGGSHPLDEREVERDSCQICGHGVHFVASPTGSWWAHDEHPFDGHDAEPSNAAHIVVLAAEVERLTSELAEARNLLKSAASFVTNTGDWEHEPSEQQIAEWMLAWGEWAGNLLPNVPEVVEVRPRRSVNAELAVIERRVAADKRILDAAKRYAAAYRATTVRPLSNAQTNAASEQLATARFELLSAVGALVEVEDTPQPQDPCGACKGTRWEDDQNWQPEQWELRDGRRPGAGRIPCGLCNLGGWSTPDGEVER